MKETRVPFKAPMVRAILSGAKWQTRRIAHGVPAPGGFKIGDVLQGQGGKPIKPPYGVPGDRILATEAWRVAEESDHLPPSALTPAHRVWYEADAPHQPGFGRLRPSMFMPFWASRIQRDITDLRVERLLDISEADAMAEGIETYRGALRWVRYQDAIDPNVSHLTAKDAYLALWEHINGPGSAMLNPMVWAYSFNRSKTQ